MDLEQIFSLCSGLAMLGWLGLALAPRLEFTRDTMPSLIIPIILGVTYAYLMFSFSGSASDDGGFGSLAEVKALFGVDALLLAGWIHYLAFDLFIGAWIVRDAQEEDQSLAGAAMLVFYIDGRAIWLVALPRFASRQQCSSGLDLVDQKTLETPASRLADYPAQLWKLSRDI